MTVTRRSCLWQAYQHAYPFGPFHLREGAAWKEGRHFHDSKREAQEAGTCVEGLGYWLPGVFPVTDFPFSWKTVSCPSSSVLCFNTIN